MFGMEIFGFNFTGESQTIIEPLNPGPKVVWGGDEKVKASHKPHNTSAESGGLRIRLRD
jgi:hypothetical protein